MYYLHISMCCAWLGWPHKYQSSRLCMGHTRLQSFAELLRLRCTVLNSFLWDLSFSNAGQKEAFFKMKDISNSWFSKETIREFTLSWKIHFRNKDKMDKSSDVFVEGYVIRLFLYKLLQNTRQRLDITYCL